MVLKVTLAALRLVGRSASESVGLESIVRSLSAVQELIVSFILSLAC